MYGYEGNEKQAIGPCKRDLEQEAKRAKERLESCKKFASAIEDFVDGESRYEIDDRDDIKALYRIFGGLTILAKKYAKNYDAILAEIERNQ